MPSDRLTRRRRPGPDSSRLESEPTGVGPAFGAAKPTTEDRLASHTDEQQRSAPLPLPRPKVPRRARGKKNESEGDLWQYSEGEHGHAVTVFEKRGRRSFYIKWWNPKARRMERRALGHSNKEKAIAQARELSDKLRLRAESTVTAPALVTIEYILKTYYREHGSKLEGQQPKEHLRRQRLWLGFFSSRSRAMTLPEHLDDTVLQDFIHVRRHGDLKVPGIALPKPARAADRHEKREAVVRDGTIDADLIYLNAALNWATQFKIGGKRLLEERPVVVPRVMPTTLRTPIAAEEDLEALLPIAESVDPQRLLRYWIEIENALGWRVSGLSAINASDIDFTPQPYAHHGRIRKNPLIDKERRDEWVPISAALARTLRALLAFLGLHAGDDAYLFPAPRSGGNRPWSRFHVRDLMERAEEAARIAHIGGLHAWRRKWHSERKGYSLKDVAAAAGYADTSSVERYRQADPETIYDVMTKPTHRVRRTEPGVVTGDAARPREPREMITAPPARKTSKPRRRPADDEISRLPAAGIGRGMGSSARSRMPDGAVVNSRDERFAVCLAIAQAYGAEHGHLLPNKRERPRGVNLLQWLKNQEIRIANGTMPADRRSALEEIAAWRDREAMQSGAAARSGHDT